MLHTLTHLAPVADALPNSTLSKKNAAPHHLPSLGFHKIQASSQSDQPQLCRPVLDRRTTTLGLCGLVLGLSLGGDKKADARRPPPPPPEEKQDPGLNGVTAKVLASKKRKALMKENIAKLREKGKAIIEPASSSSSSSE